MALVAVPMAFSPRNYGLEQSGEVSHGCEAVYARHCNLTHLMQNREVEDELRLAVHRLFTSCYKRLLILAIKRHNFMPF